MAIVKTEQYREITSEERRDQDALSSEHAQRLRRNVNVIGKALASTMLLPNQVWKGNLSVAHANTNEFFEAKYPCIPWVGNKLNWRVCAERTAGTGTVTLKLRFDKQLYMGPASAADLSTYFSGDVAAMTVVVNSDDPIVYDNSIANAFPHTPIDALFSGSYVTLTSDASLTNTNAVIYSMAVWSEWA